MNDILQGQTLNLRKVPCFHPQVLNDFGISQTAAPNPTGVAMNAAIAPLNPMLFLAKPSMC